MKRIEYIIDKTGKVTENVLQTDGANCEEETASIEQALGYVTDRQRKDDGDPQYRASSVKSGH